MIKSICKSLKEFKESLIFENEKHNAFRNATNFKKIIKEKYKEDIDYTKVYRNIINYQLSVYGEMLDTGKWYIPPTKVECQQTKENRTRTIATNENIRKLEALEKRVEKSNRNANKKV